MKKSKVFIMSCIAVFILASATVLAAQVEKTITVSVGDVKILFDGTQRVLSDVNHKEVEPMIYEGTTYVPIRAISENLGKNVDWEDETKTVKISNNNFSQDDVEGAQKVITEFFDLFSQQKYYEMKLISSGMTSTHDFSQSVFGMKEAKLTYCKVDETALNGNSLAFLCTFDMTPSEDSVYDPEQTTVSFYIVMDKISNQYVISEFATGI